MLEKYYGFRLRSIFSTEGCFGCRENLNGGSQNPSWKIDLFGPDWSLFRAYRGTAADRAPHSRGEAVELPPTLGTKNQPEIFQTEVFSWTSAGHVRSKMLVFFSGFGGPDRSFWSCFHRDIRPKTCSLG